MWRGKGGAVVRKGQCVVIRYQAASSPSGINGGAVSPALIGVDRAQIAIVHARYACSVVTRDTEKEDRRSVNVAMPLCTLKTNLIASKIPGGFHAKFAQYVASLLKKDIEVSWCSLRVSRRPAGDTWQASVPFQIRGRLFAESDSYRGTRFGDIASWYDRPELPVHHPLHQRVLAGEKQGLREQASGVYLGELGDAAEKVREYGTYYWPRAVAAARTVVSQALHLETTTNTTREPLDVFEFYL
ncbi:hypothetical protein HPB48_016809 [Haemaphysalis longicornis]|uniref:Uncharacterized protein n=1 Tax=Haemaphysalis longicornis TaxID=44386 RepID=A0A9J6GRS2_HAELO|nr:hypothetical protein HPB48_016809 [Haemaphysalis longicornis]